MLLELILTIQLGKKSDLVAHIEPQINGNSHFIIDELSEINVGLGGNSDKLLIHTDQKTLRLSIGKAFVVLPLNNCVLGSENTATENWVIECDNNKLIIESGNLGN